MRSRAAGFTLLEVLMAASILGFAAQVIYIVLINGMVLHAKNAAVNVAHQEARNAAARLLRDIHAAVSIPQLIDVNRNNVESQPRDASGNPTGTAGVSLQTVAGGPYNLKNDPGNANLIQFRMQGFIPLPGQRLILPHYGVEDTITKVTSNSTDHVNVWTATAQEERIKEKKDSYIIAYVTRRSSYVVVNGELRYYPEAVGSYVVVARYITTPTPFSVPLNASGTPDSRYVSVKLATTDPRFTHRAFKAENTLIEASIPFRAQLTKYQ
jgi:prepilin-type N-terminal cleavage/methylation domain-containing protein